MARHIFSLSGRSTNQQQGLPAIKRDRTAQKRIEDALQLAKLDAQARAEELTAILDAAPAMTLIVRDPKCREMIGGRVAYDLLRLPYGSNLSKSAVKKQRPTNFRVLKDGKELRASELPIQRATATGKEIRDTELTIAFHDGDTHEFFGNAAPLLDPAGKVRGAVGVFVDITERKRAESSIRQLYASMLRVQEEERRRIARELHDSVGQNLTGLVMSLSTLKKRSIGLDQKSRVVLADCLNSVRELAREVRTLSRLLHPPLLDEFGLPEAIRTFVRGFSQRSGIQVTLNLPSRPRRFARDLETTVFRVVQEGLTNVYKHARTNRAAIRMREKNGQLILEIQDFGRGAKFASVAKLSKSTGIGIPGIRERLQQFRGELQIKSNRRGTLLRAMLPLPARKVRSKAA